MWWSVAFLHFHLELDSKLFVDVASINYMYLPVYLCFLNVVCMTPPSVCLHDKNRPRRRRRRRKKRRRGRKTRSAGSSRRIEKKNKRKKQEQTDARGIETHRKHNKFHHNTYIIPQAICCFSPGAHVVCGEERTP